MSTILRRLKDLQAPSYSIAIPEWFGKAKVRATCDTVVGLTRGDHYDLRQALKKTGAHLIPHDYNPYWRSWHVTRPKLTHVEPLAEYAECRNRIDIAIDFEFDDQDDADDCRAWLANHVNMNWKKCDKRWFIEKLWARDEHGEWGWQEYGPEGLYWEDTEGGGLPARCLYLYEKFHKRGRFIIRLELRFQCTAAVRANWKLGLDDWSLRGLSEVNPRSVFEKHLKLTDVSEEWLQGHRKSRTWRDTSRQQFDQFIEHARSTCTVMKGVVQPLPTQAMPAAITNAFTGLIPTRLTWGPST